MPVKQWNTDPDQNNRASPLGAPENMAPSGVNNTIRQIMADVATWYKFLTPAVEAASTNGRAYEITTGDGSTDAAAGDVLFVRLARASTVVNPTLAVNGGSDWNIRSGDGGAIGAGGLKAGVPYLLYATGNQYRVLNMSLTQQYTEDTLQVRKLRNGTPTLELSSAGQLDLKTNASTVNLRVTSSGDMHVEGGITMESSVISSDEREKEDIGGLADAADILKYIDPATFRYKGKAHRHIGFIAQHIDAVDPRLIKRYPNREGELRLGIRTTGLLAVLWQQVKVLQARVAELERA